MNKRRDIGLRIALAGIGTGIALICVALAYYLSYLSLTFIVVSAGGVLLPLTRGYYREALISAVVVTLIGVFIVNVFILIFVMVSGFYVVATVFYYEKRLPSVIGYAVKAGYSVLVFFIAYQVTKSIFVDVSRIPVLSGMSATLCYVVLNAVFVLMFLAHDYLLITAFLRLRVLMKRVIKKPLD